MLLCILCAFTFPPAFQSEVAKAIEVSSFESTAVEMGEWLLNNQDGTSRNWVIYPEWPYVFYMRSANLLVALAELYRATGDVAYQKAAMESADWLSSNLQFMDQKTCEEWKWDNPPETRHFAKTWGKVEGGIVNYFNTKIQAHQIYSRAHELAMYLLALNSINASQFSDHIAKGRNWFFTDADATSPWGEDFNRFPNGAYRTLSLKYKVDDAIEYWPFQWTDENGVIVQALVSLGELQKATEVANWLVDPRFGYNTTYGVFNDGYFLTPGYKENGPLFGITDPNATWGYYWYIGTRDYKTYHIAQAALGLLDLYEANPNTSNSKKYLESCIHSINWMLTELKYDRSPNGICFGPINLKWKGQPFPISDVMYCTSTAVMALSKLYRVTGNSSYLSYAQAGAQWIRHTWEQYGKNGQEFMPGPNAGFTSLGMAIQALLDASVYSVAIDIDGLPSTLATNIYVDGSRIGEAKGGDVVRLSFDLGTSHDLAVSEVVNGTPGTRYNCSAPSQTVSYEESLKFTYIKQYYLTVISASGSPQGEGWYNEGTIARFSVTSPVDHGNGTRSVFVSWSGDSTSNETSSTITMNRPSEVTALWKVETTTQAAGVKLEYVVAVAIIIVVAIAAFLVAKRKKRAKA